jgi:rRNA-processing protein FCF1
MAPCNGSMKDRTPPQMWQHTGVLVTPRPGVNRANLRDSLRSVYTEAYNFRGGGPQGSYSRLLAYLDWTSNSVRMLSGQIGSADLDQLVLTRRYELLLAGVGTMAGSQQEVQRVVNGLVSTELDQRIAAFEEAIKALDEQINRWSGLMDFVMPDTSFYIQHSQKFEEADFASLLEVEWMDHQIHVLVPIVVVDELDRLKESKDRIARWRAGYTLAVLDRLFERRTGMAVLRKPEVAVANAQVAERGPVTVELLFDPPGHIRLPIADDEMIDRAVAVEPLAARKVTLLTYDTGQSMRARMAGLPVVKLRKEIGKEPE